MQLTSSMRIRSGYKRILVNPYSRAALIVLAIFIRILIFPRLNMDIHQYVDWYNYIVSHGGFPALADSFTGYSPLFSYILLFLTKLDFLSPLIAIKLISALFDFIAAYVVFSIIQLKDSPGIDRWGGFLATLLSPVVFVTSSYWGQSDIFYITFMLICTYYLLRDRLWIAMLFFSLAFSMKLQAILIAPLLLILILRRKIPWSTLALPPLVYILLCIPAWLAGRPIKDMLFIYSEQVTSFRRLSLLAPNIYNFIDDSHFATVFPIGIAISILLITTYIYFSARNKFPFTKERVLLEVTLILFLAPSILPAMHERYFYPAALFSIILAFYAPRYLLVVVTLQATTLLSYLPYLRGYPTDIVKIGAVFNMIVLLWLVAAWLKQYPLLTGN